MEGRTPRRDDQTGSALILTLLVGSLALTLGIGCIIAGEAESLQAKAFTERARCRDAARDVLAVAASWFLEARPGPTLPEPDAWILDRRRGDADGDGKDDDSCDGSTRAGRWSAWPVADVPGTDPLGMAADLACGTAETPDLLLEDRPWLGRLGKTLGDDVIVERIAVHAPDRWHGRSRRGLAIECTVALRRGTVVVARCTAVGFVAPLPSLGGEEVIAAGGDVRIATGASVHWGLVRADGDVELPAVGDAGFPASGLPRRHDGAPESFATGGLVDWDLLTGTRECLLTELIGSSERGVRVPSLESEAPALPDPWLSVRAGRRLLVGDKPLGRDGLRQAFPYDPRATTVVDDLSHLTAAWGPGDPLLEGRLQSLADGSAAAAPGMHRYLLDVSAAGPEPRWRENGLGPARTASDWLGGPDGPPMIAAFLHGSAPPPERVTVAGGRGVVILQARSVVVAARAKAFERDVDMPGEPFLDTGIDADSDDLTDPSTGGNGSWDRDLDDDGVPDTGTPQAWLFESLALPRWQMPFDDKDTSRMRRMPHEAFLNFDYPEKADGPLRVDFTKVAKDHARPVADLDGDGIVRAGLDLMTTVAHDDAGALVSVPCHLQALLVNLEGDVVVTEGTAIVGAVRASGSVTLEPGASVRFDAALALVGHPAIPGLTLGALTDVAWPPQRGPGRRPEPGAAPPGDPPTPAPPAPVAAPPPPDQPGKAPGPGAGRPHPPSRPPDHGEPYIGPVHEEPAHFG